MNTFLKMFAVEIVSWFVSIFLSFVMIIIAAGVTEKWGASRAGSAMMVLLAAVCVVFIAGTIVVHFAGKKITAGQGAWLYTICYLACSVITVGVLGFVTMVLFNR